MQTTKEKTYDLKQLLKKIEKKNGSLVIHQPQYLCKKCGLCCKTAFTCYEYSYLKELAEQGDKFATDFLTIFEPYPSLQEALNAEPERVSDMINDFEKAGENRENLTIFRCKHINEYNLCSIHNNRPDVCREHPSQVWAMVPDSCGYKEWLKRLQNRDRRYINILKDYQRLKFKDIDNSIVKNVPLYGLTDFFVTDLGLKPEDDYMLNLHDSISKDGKPLTQVDMPVNEFNSIIDKKLSYRKHIISDS